MNRRTFGHPAPRTWAPPVRKVAGLALAGFLLLGAMCGASAAAQTAEDRLESELEEPDIELPGVVLELEDLSVDVINPVLPEEDLLPSDFTLPVDTTVLVIPESALSAPGPGGDETKQREGNITVEAVVGAGTRNHLQSDISLFRYGESPEGKLSFSHETSDGFSGEPPGTGYNQRSDSLTGSIRFAGGSTNSRIDGSFEDDEGGLQGQGSFYSRVDRRAGLEGTIGINQEGTFRLTGGVDGSVTSRLLTQSESAVPPAEKFTEYVVGGFLEGRLQYERVYLGLAPRYRYRTGGPKDEYLLDRFELAGLFGVELSPTVRLDGSLSWFWSEPSGHRLPFSLQLSLYPSDQFSFSLEGGYRIVQYDLWDVTAAYPYGLQPDTLEDNRGFYGILSTHYSIFRGWVLFGRVEYMDNAALLNPAVTQDPASGLFPIGQEKMETLEAEAGVRWNGPANLSLLARLETELLDRPNFSPQYLLDVEAGWKNRSERFETTLTTQFSTGVNDTAQLPLVDLETSYRLSENLMVSAQLHDLLAPAMDRPRLAWEPYILEGFRFTFRTHLTF